MTKTFLLAASALTALAFAGAANAGTITSAALSDITVVSGSTVTPLPVASEATLDATVFSADNADSFVVTTLASPVSTTAGSSVSFVVTYTLTGPGTFGTVAVADLTAVATGAGIVGAPSGVATLSADKKTATFIVTYAVTGNDAAITGFRFNAVDIAASAKQDISIASETKLNAAGVQTSIDTVAATKIVTFKSVLGTFDNDAVTVTAALPSFTSFQGGDSESDSLGYSIVPGILGSLAGGDALEIGDVFAGATAVVKGPQVEALAVTLAGDNADEDTVTATSGDYVLTAAELNTATLKLNQNPVTPVEIEAGSYTVAVTPEFEEGFAGNAAATLTVLTVALDGTNFVAPWFALANPTASSTLRLANNSSSDTGPVIIALKANNGAAAPTGTFTLADGIPAGGFVSITGAQLKAAFGTSATNGDLQVTIQSDVTNVSAKVRTTQASGQIFENSLGTLSGSNF